MTRQRALPRAIDVVAEESIPCLTGKKQVPSATRAHASGSKAQETQWLVDLRAPRIAKITGNFRQRTGRFSRENRPNEGKRPSAARFVRGSGVIMIGHAFARGEEADIATSFGARAIRAVGSSHFEAWEPRGLTQQVLLSGTG